MTEMIVKEYLDQVINVRLLLGGTLHDLDLDIILLLLLVLGLVVGLGLDGRLDHLEGDGEADVLRVVEVLFLGWLDVGGGDGLDLPLLLLLVVQHNLVQVPQSGLVLGAVRAGGLASVTWGTGRGFLGVASFLGLDANVDLWILVLLFVGVHSVDLSNVDINFVFGFRKFLIFCLFLGVGDLGVPHHEQGRLGLPHCGLEFGRVELPDGAHH